MITDVRLLLGLVVLHGVFWSGLLSASASDMTNILPENRRAEGIGSWGLATLAAVAVATAVLNVAMAVIASTLPEHRREARLRLWLRRGRAFRWNSAAASSSGGC